MILAILLLAACRTTVTGSITGKQYNLDIGCAEDMKGYQREREAVIGEKSEATEPEVQIDCPTAPGPQP